MSDVETYVLFCPVCCSQIDAETSPETEGQEQEFDCGACGQEFKMVISPARMNEHSLL